MAVEAGKIFREAWIAGVNKHYPGEPKAGYVAPWDETPEWERHAAGPGAGVTGQGGEEAVDADQVPLDDDEESDAAAESRLLRVLAALLTDPPW